MRIAVMILALSAAAVFAACGGGSDKPKSGEGAADAAKRQTRFLNDGQFGNQWDELHPGQQADVPRERYVNCARGLPHSAGTIDILETHDEAIDIAAVPERTSTTVVLRTGDGASTTAREVRVGDRWRWTLASSAYEGFKAGGCPQP